jgi:hypothetical protein
MSNRSEIARASQAARNIEILKTSLLVVGLVASLAGVAVGIKVWAAAKSPDEIAKEKEYRQSLNELAHLAARAEGRTPTASELKSDADLKAPAWSGPAIVAASAAGLALTLVATALLAAAAQRLRLQAGKHDQREG